MNVMNPLPVLDFLANHPTDFATCFAALKHFQQQYFTALELEQNPLVAHLESWEQAQLAFVIQEYSGFSNEAIHMLLDALIRNHDWPLLRQEILHNMAEEQGLMTRGIPHLEIMRQGYRTDLGLETDYIVYSATTQTFILQMRHLFKHDDNAFSAGGLLAFEGIAITEFKILDALVQHYLKLGGTSIHKHSLTQRYIDGHKEFEIGHEAELRKAIEPYITADNCNRFVRGYLLVCLTMHTWWEKLAIETAFRRLSQTLFIPVAETFDVSQIFQDESPFIE